MDMQSASLLIQTLEDTVRWLGMPDDLLCDRQFSQSEFQSRTPYAERSQQVFNFRLKKKSYQVAGDFPVPSAYMDAPY